MTPFGIDIERRDWQAVVARLDPGGRLLTTRSLSGGLSSFMTVLEIEGSAGDVSRVVVRRARDPERQGWSLDLDREFELVRRLYQLGLAAPEPLTFDDTASVLGQPYAVFGYVEGAPLLESPDPVRMARRLADRLMAIHQVDPGEVADVELPQRADVVDEYLTTMPDDLDHSLDEGRVREVITAQRGRLRSGPASLLHGDYWPGNVVWDHAGDDVVAVIDWEDASLGDPMADLGTTRLDLLFAFGHAAMDAFTQQYLGAGPVDDTHLAVWDLVAALRPAGQISVWAADWADLGRPDLTSTGMRAAHRRFLDQALVALV